MRLRLGSLAILDEPLRVDIGIAKEESAAIRLNPRYDGRLTAARMLLDQPNFTPQKLDEGCEIVACQTRRRHNSDIGYLNDTGIAGNAFYGDAHTIKRVPHCNSR